MPTLVFLNVKIVGDGAIQLFHTEYKGLNVSSGMDLTNWRITMNLASAVKPMWRLTPLISKLKRASHVLTHSNVLTAVVNIKWTQPLVYSEKISSIETGIKGSILRSVKTGSSQSIQSWIETLKHDFWQLKNPFSEHSQKHFYRQHHPWDLFSLWHYSLTRTSMVHYSYYPQLYLLQRGGSSWIF